MKNQKKELTPQEKLLIKTALGSFQGQGFQDDQLTIDTIRSITKKLEL